MASITLNGLKFTTGEKLKDSHVELIKDFIEHVSVVKSNYNNLEKAVEKNKEETTEQFNKMHKSVKELKSKLSVSTVETQTLTKRLEDKVKELESTKESSKIYSTVVRDLLELRKTMLNGREEIAKATNNIRTYNQNIQKLVKETEELLKHDDDDEDFCRTEVAEEHSFNFQQKANKLHEQTKIISQCQKENDRISAIKNNIATCINEFQDKSELHQNVFACSTELLQWKLLRTKKEIKDSIIEQKQAPSKKDDSDTYDFDKSPRVPVPVPVPTPTAVPVPVPTQKVPSQVEMNFETKKENILLSDSDGEDEDSSSEKNIFNKMGFSVGNVEELSDSEESAETSEAEDSEDSESDLD